MKAMMRSMKYALALASACAVAVIISSISNADELTKRQLLKRVDLTGSGQTEVVVTRIEIAPGGKVPRHSHNGDEFVYVLKGGTASVPGGPPIRFKEGQTIHFPRGKVHGGFTVTGTTPIKAITTHIVDKGKPLLVPAQ